VKISASIGYDAQYSSLRWMMHVVGLGFCSFHSYDQGGGCVAALSINAHALQVDFARKVSMDLCSKVLWSSQLGARTRAKIFTVALFSYRAVTVRGHVSHFARVVTRACLVDVTSPFSGTEVARAIFKLTFCGEKRTKQDLSSQRIQTINRCRNMSISRFIKENLTITPQFDISR
jgi:hypothetical protein